MIAARDLQLRDREARPAGGTSIESILAAERKLAGRS
jgi:hypothetical protein